MEHVGVFGIIVNLVLATWCAVYIGQTRKISRHPVLPPLLLYSICYILLVFLFLIWLYFTLNLKEQLLPPILQDGGVVCIAALEMMMVAAMFSIYRSFQGKRISRNLVRIFWLWQTLFLLSFGVRIFLSPGWGKRALRAFHFEVFDNVILLEIVILIVILLYSRKISDPAQRKMSNGFAVMYLSRYFLPLIVGLVIAFITPLPRLLKMIIATGLFVYCSFVPIIWIRKFFLPAEGRGRIGDCESSIYKSMVKKHAISQREEEILKLLLEGKSHKDVEEELFISYHTVKNHIYNLYQKLGVKNRHQLFHLFSDRNGM